jgi:hypothetical protein
MPALTPEERAEMEARHATLDGLQTIAPTGSSDGPLRPVRVEEVSHEGSR